MSEYGSTLPGCLSVRLWYALDTAMLTTCCKFPSLWGLCTHGGDTSWPKQFQNGGPKAIYETLHIEYRIVCCIETYLIHIYHMSKCSKCNWYKQVYWRILYMKCAFSYKWIIPKYCLCYLNELTFNGKQFSFIECLTIFCVVFVSYLMVINSKKYKSKYPKIIWWIMPCIMSKLWKN